jgi:hypothetical protein
MEDDDAYNNLLKVIINGGGYLNVVEDAKAKIRIEDQRFYLGALELTEAIRHKDLNKALEIVENLIQGQAVQLDLYKEQVTSVKQFCETIKEALMTTQEPKGDTVN